MDEKEYITLVTKNDIETIKQYVNDVNDVNFLLYTNKFIKRFLISLDYEKCIYLMSLCDKEESLFKSQNGSNTWFQNVCLNKSHELLKYVLENMIDNISQNDLNMGLQSSFCRLNFGDSDSKIKFLLSYGANPTTALICCSLINSQDKATDITKHIIENYDVNVLDNSGTADLDILKFILYKRLENPLTYSNYKNLNREYVSIYNNHYDELTSLVEQKDITFYNDAYLYNFWLPPLFIFALLQAKKNNDTKIVEYLINRGINTNIKTDDINILNGFKIPAYDSKLLMTELKIN